MKNASESHSLVLRDNHGNLHSIARFFIFVPTEEVDESFYYFLIVLFQVWIAFVRIFHLMVGKPLLRFF